MLGNKVLITGGSGSLGTAILQRAHDEGWNTEFTVVARNETKMSALKKKFPDVRCEIGDVRDLSWLHTIFPGHDTIAHTAAIKIIPVAELNVRETVLTNVIGSMNVAVAAVQAGAKRVIGVSTDKSCLPNTQYGASKFLMEGLFREANTWGNTEFNLVRYGNVLRSNASVIPFFEKLKDSGERLRVTEPSMTRFWLSMGEAIDLIIDAAEFKETGIILVPKPPAMSMHDLALAISDQEYDVIGVRPGEKIHEHLISSGESLHTRDDGKYFVIYPPNIGTDKPLSVGFEYVSSAPLFWLSKQDLYDKINSYNPYGGPWYE